MNVDVNLEDAKTIIRPAQVLCLSCGMIIAPEKLQDNCWRCGNLLKKET